MGIVRRMRMVQWNGNCPRMRERGPAKWEDGQGQIGSRHSVALAAHELGTRTGEVADEREDGFEGGISDRR